jgi:hypothetical protein
MHAVVNITLNLPASQYVPCRLAPTYYPCPGHARVKEEYYSRSSNREPSPRIECRLFECTTKRDLQDTWQADVRERRGRLSRLERNAAWGPERKPQVFKRFSPTLSSKWNGTTSRRVT